VAFWNIERGRNLDLIKLAFRDPEAFIASAKAPARQTGENEANASAGTDWDAVREELEFLRRADIIILNEVDWGMKRSGYRAVIEELGDALDMNWAYGTEFVEIDPVVLGTESFDDIADPEERARLRAANEASSSMLRALHGNAVLSRYPIRSARLVPFATAGYDWFESEWKLPRFEVTKRRAAVLLGEALGREVRRGGRTNLLVTLDIPGLPEGQVTVAATHLENRADPTVRRRQALELMELLKDIRTPVIIAGDLNTTGSAAKPRTLTQTMIRSATTAESLAKTALRYLTSVGRVYSWSVTAYKSTRFRNDPTVIGVKPIAANPEGPLFAALQKFRFADGRTLDFRGDALRSANGRSGKLANSNERAAKGFVHTFAFERNIGSKGRFKLDWILVKPYVEHPRDAKQPYRFAPHAGRTLHRLNFAPSDRISDHSPMTVDLPLQEPRSPSHP
jgi:endonuclease/exonuclease/phosphatase family metal-dependent hydrolase